MSISRPLKDMSIDSIKKVVWEYRTVAKASKSLGITRQALYLHLKKRELEVCDVVREKR